MGDKAQEAEDKRVFEGLYASNDPQLRADVKAALEGKYGITDPDPFYLELSLQYGDRSFYDAQRTVSPEQIDELKAAIETSIKELDEEPESARYIVLSNIIDVIQSSWNYRYYSDLPPLSEWQVANQPAPETFTDLLEQGEDPRMVALMMINIYGDKQDFTELASVVGTDVLSWENKRSLDYQERKAHKPENKNLSDDMRVEPAGLVAVEPYVDLDRDFHYDIYGSTVAEVTSFAIQFVPNKGVNSRNLQKHVEHAVNRLIEEGEVTFQPPTSSYKKPHNAYKRPKGIDTGYYSESHDYWGSFLTMWKIKNPRIVRDHWDLFHVADEDTNEVFDSGEVSGGYINQWLLADDFPENIPQKLIDDIKASAESMNYCRHTTVNDEGHVVLNNTLILDDVLQLYEFCDGFLTPSVKVAQTLEAARYAEECGPLKSPGGLGDEYSKDHLRLTNQLGNFDDVEPEQIVEKALHDITALKGRGGSAHMAFLQAASLAHGTLMGVLPDGTGQYPTLAQITDGTKLDQTTSLVTIANETVTERTGQLLRHAVTLFGEPDSDLPLQVQFANASETMSELLRYQQRIKDICDHYLDDNFGQKRYSSKRRMFDELNDQPQTPDDLLSQERSHALWCLSSHKRYEPQHEIIDIINALEGRTGDDGYWIKKEFDRTPKDKDKADKEPDPAKEFKKDSIMPEGLDVLGGYIWRCCKEQAFAKYTEPERNFLPTVRANIDIHGGVTPPQLPRTFDDTSYITRPKGSPFPRPNTDLPDELADFLPKRPEDRAEHAQLPDPSVIWGKVDDPST